jgi:hypothetical protein
MRCGLDRAGKVIENAYSVPKPPESDFGSDLDRSIGR